MKNTLTILLCLVFFAANTQNIFEEDFETGVATGWTQTSNPGSDGWLIGDNLSSSYWPIDSHTVYAASNDDNCNCDKGADYFITPSIDLSGETYINMELEYTFDNYYGGSAYVLATSDTSLGWDTLKNIATSYSWAPLSIDLSAYAGDSNVHIAFLYNDQGYWTSGLAIDDIEVYSYIVNPFEAGIIDIEGLDGGCNADTADIDISFTNNGTDSITTLDVIVMVNGAMYDTLNFAPSPALAPGDTGYVNTLVDISAYGEYEVEAILDLAGDSDASNDTFADATATWGEYDLGMYDYNMGFELADSAELAKLEVIDNNNDGSTWGVWYYSGPDTSNEYMLGYEYNSNNDADDWLMTSCFNLDSGEHYVLNVDAKQGLNSWPEDLLVMMGYDNSVAAMTDTLIANQNLDTAWMTLSDTLNVDYSGTYYFGFKANSIADQFRLYIDNINISTLTAVGLNDNASNGVAIYPNPASDYFIIELNNEITSEVSIYNVTGKLVNNIRSNGNTMINTKDWSKGIYFINIENSLGIQNQKLIVE